MEGTSLEGGTTRDDDGGVTDAGVADGRLQEGSRVGDKEGQGRSGIEDDGRGIEGGGGEGGSGADDDGTGKRFPPRANIFCRA